MGYANTFSRRSRDAFNLLIAIVVLSRQATKIMAFFMPEGLDGLVATLAGSWADAPVIRAKGFAKSFRSFDTGTCG